MNFKKIIALLMTLAMMLSLGAVVAADEGVAIVSPANGEMIEYSGEETELLISAGEGMLLKINLDGAALCDVEAETEEVKVNLGTLALGKHKVSIIAISGSASYKAESAFSVVQSVVNEKYFDTFTGGNSGSLAPYSSRPDLGPDENGEKIPAYYGAFDGVDGDAEGSIGFRFMKTATEITMDDGAEICYVMEPLPTGLNSKFTLEYDLLLLNPGAWEIRIGNKQGGSRKYSQLALSHFLDENGYVSGTETVYPVGEWMHIKHEVNVSEGITNVYLDGNEVLKNISVGTANLTDLEIFKFQYYATSPEGPQGFNLDNVRIVSEDMYSGISPLKYVVSDGSEKNVPDNATITEATKKIIFQNDIKGFTPWDNKTSFTVLADGEELEINSIQKINDNSFSVELSENLPEKAHIEVLSEYSGTPIKTFFDVNAITFGIYSVDFRKGSTNIYSSSQLVAGESVNCFLGVKTDLEEDKNVLAIIGVYSGNRLVSLQTKTVKINGNTTAVRQKIVPVSIPENIEDISVEIFFIDDLPTRKPLSYPFVLGK